ncbi:hypothetical protein NUU61_006227 [Penicillium alfredii]|uniref:C2H2-type domain-containing protein n=1 Tax=Penicillium alfredii TaxID=1506179 RepID=A0A9W9F0I2_9EURO|nr:uncharacterized protein NUU61_006227 [Penicillium alfredii]KAJ5091357.1 hypothetical protein NUU61_006227 [Penicillium alfredii]
MLWCEMCAETFECEDDWGEHMDECGHWPQCETCSLLFETQLDCHEHMNEADHWAQRFECETCPRAFLSMEAADHHMNVSGHWHPRIGCETCQIKFFTQSSANRHMDIAGHWAPRFGCDSCNKMFRSQEVANQHMTAAGHRAARVGGVHFEIPAQSRKLAVVDQNKLQSPPKTVKTPKSIQTTKTTCPKCGRQFQDENSLKMVRVNTVVNVLKEINVLTILGSSTSTPRFTKDRLSPVLSVRPHIQSPVASAITLKLPLALVPQS